MNAPRVSVVIPSYNGARYIVEALESVLRQTWTDFELLVLDDGSQDNTPELVTRFNDPRLRLSRNPARLGLAGNWNRGVELTTGEYILIFHQDDRLAPTMLETQVAQLDAQPEAGYAYSAYRLVGADGGVWTVARPFSRDHVWPGEVEFREHIRKPYVQCATVLVRRACYEALGTFDSRLRYALDWEMWLRIESHGYRVAYSSLALADWRQHPASESRALQRDGYAQVQDIISALDLTFSRIPPEHAGLCSLRSYAYFELTKQWLLRAGSSAGQRQGRLALYHLLSARRAFAHGADWRLLPFLAGDLLRFLRHPRSLAEPGS